MLIAMLLLLLAAAAQAPKPSEDPWGPLRVLEGSWEGTAKGEPGAGTVERRYEFVLRGRFLQARNKSTYPPQSQNPKGEVHEDWGFFSYDRSRKRIVFRQFHVEGFVNQYLLDSVSPDGKTLVFVSEAIENISPGWRARETYTTVSDREMRERFELAAPGKDFTVYSESRLRKR